MKKVKISKCSLFNIDQYIVKKFLLSNFIAISYSKIE